MGMYDGVKLEEPAYDKKIWDEMADAKDPKRAVAFPLMKVDVAANAAFIKKAPKIKEFLTKYRASNAMISKALVKMREAGGQDAAQTAAKTFLKAQKDVWTQWVPDDVAKRVEAAL
jgi:glycine betaine/proline transport system substrate-binding protein